MKIKLTHNAIAPEFYHELDRTSRANAVKFISLMQENFNPIVKVTVKKKKNEK